MSSSVTVMDGGGKYRVKVEKRVAVSDGAARYYMSISLVDWGASTTLVFDTFEQASGFLGDMTQAVLACAADLREPSVSKP